MDDAKELPDARPMLELPKLGQPLPPIIFFSQQADRILLLCDLDVSISLPYRQDEGDLDARERDRHPTHPGDPRPGEAGDDADLYPSLHPHPATGPSFDPSGAEGAPFQSQRPGGHDLCAAHLDIGLVHAPEGRAITPIPANPPRSFGRGAMNPTQDRYWIDLDAALLHPLRQIPVADAVLAVPTNAHHDDLNRKTTPRERHPSRPPHHPIGKAQLVLTQQSRCFWVKQRR